MNEEIIIGPNSCTRCGGEYGEHLEACDRKDSLRNQLNSLRQHAEKLAEALEASYQGGRLRNEALTSYRADFPKAK